MDSKVAQKFKKEGITIQISITFYNAQRNNDVNHRGMKM